MTVPLLLASISAYATEGGLDGRFQPATCFNPMIALGHLPAPGAALGLWERYEEVLPLAKDHGVTHLRFDLSWARLEPREGAFADEAFSRYRTVVAKAQEIGLLVGVGTCDGAWPAWLGLEPWLWAWSETVTLRYIERVANTFSTVEAIEFLPAPDSLRGGFLDASGPPWRTKARVDADIVAERLHQLRARCTAEGFIRPWVDDCAPAVPLLRGVGPLAQPAALLNW